MNYEEDYIVKVKWSFIMQFDEIQSQDFVTFSQIQPAHIKLEQHLIERGGAGVEGAEFKKKALVNAGWKYGALVSFGAHPDAAAKAFNYIRSAVQDESLTPKEVLETIKMNASDS